jgi:signal peptidase I
VDVPQQRRRFDEEPAQPEKKRMSAEVRGALSFGRWLWEWTKSLLIAFALFILIRTFLVEAFRIPTGSMENTLLVGDFLLVNKAVYGAQVPGTKSRLPAFDQPQRNDVIVFTPPHEPSKNYVKRLVGLPGDTLAMRDKVLYLNGQPVVEEYSQHADPLDVYSPDMNWQRQFLLTSQDPGNYRPTRDTWGPIVVPEHSYFVLGDNRDDSEDSRYWGFVDAGAVKGQPLFIYYSFNPRTMRRLPWFTEIRWGRIGGTIH